MNVLTWLTNLPEPMRAYLIGAAGDGTGGLISGFVTAVVQAAGSRVRRSFATPKKTQALQRAAAAAFATALDEWAINADETAHYQDLFRNWLLHPAVLGEFKKLLAPSEISTLDLETLQDEFESSGLSADHLGKVSFDVLVKDMVGAFYQTAAEEPALQGTLNIGLLRQLADRMGALERYSQHQAKASEQAVNHLAVLRQVAEQIATANGKPSPEQLAALETHYRQMIIDQFERLTFQGLSPSGVPISLPLEQIYVELKAVADVPEAADTYSAEERRLLLEAEGRGNLSREELALQLDALRAERWNRQARQESHRLQRRSIQETLDDPTQRGVVILGDPGSGKTTLLHYQALRAARLSGETALLPIFVPLAAYDDFLRRESSNRSLGFFLAAYYEQWRSLPGLAPLFEQALTQGRALVLLDGLDEVLDTSTRQFVAEQAGALIRQWAPQGNRFALSSRIVGYREARLPGDLPHVTVLDFGRSEIELFAHQWCLTYEIWVTKDTTTARQNAATEEHDLLEEVRSNESVERLAASPLLLTMLALLRRHVGKLPDRRVELYERYVRTLVDNWRTYRSPGARQQAEPRLDPHWAIAHLIQLAFWLQQHKPSGTARRQELEDALEAICLRYEGHDPATATDKARVEARQNATRFLQEMRSFAGLLAERGRDAFGFLHLTFQEYFCGRALARMKPEERWSIIRSHLHRPRWREPILLCAGQLGVMEQRQEDVSELAAHILQAKSEHEGILHRDLILTAALAADDVGLTNATLDSLAERLAALQTSHIPTVRDTALTGLAHLARIGHPPAVATLEQSLQHQDLQLYVMQALRLVIGAEGCMSLRQVITAKLKDGDYYVQRAAIGALAGLVPTDPDIRQAITAKLEDRANYVQWAAIEALAGLVSTDPAICQIITAKLEDRDSDVRRAAIGALAGLVSTDPAICQIITAKLEDKDSNVRQAAIGALAGLVPTDPDIRQAITVKLEDKNSNVQQAAIYALAGIVSTDPAIRQVVTAKLEDGDSDVRRAAIEALAGIVSTDPAIRQVVTAKLEDGDSDVRRAAIEALAGIVSTDPAIRQVVTAKLEDGDSNVRQAAIGALAGLVPTNPDIRQAITAKLEDRANYMQWAAIKALAGLVSTDPDIRQAITAKLDDEGFRVRRAAIEALAGLVSTDPRIRQIITAKLEDKDSNVRRAAIGALAGLVPTDPDIRQAITAKLEDRANYVQWAAIYALAGLVSTDPDIRQTLTAKLEDRADNVQAAIGALAGLVPTDPDIRQAITAKLEDRANYVQWAAIEALAGLVSTDPDIRQAITAKLEDKDSNVQGAAIEALAGLVPTDPAIRQVITAKLEDRDSDVRRAAIGALAGLVSIDPAIRQVITAELEDKDSDVQGAAIEALAGLVPTDPAIRQVITAKLKDGSYDVQRAAIEALAPLTRVEKELRHQLIFWLGTVGESYRSDIDTGRETRRLLAEIYGPLLAEDATLLSRVVAMLSSPAWPARQGAAWALIAMTGGPPPYLLPTLHNLLNDQRGEESWLARLQAAGVFLNVRDLELSRRAITLALEALDYATQPWYGIPHEGAQVRQTAVRILGQLDPLYCDNSIFARLARVLEEDEDENVRDAAYGALLRLAAAPEVVTDGQ